MAQTSPDFKDIKQFSLNSCLEACDLDLKENDNLSYYSMRQEFLKPKSKETFKKIIKYGMFDAILTKELVEKTQLFISKILEAEMFNVSIIDIFTKTTAKCEVIYFQNQLLDQNLYFPKVVYDDSVLKNSYLGAINYNLNSDLSENKIYHNVFGLDFTSQYPSMIMSYNISPETLLYAGPDKQTFKQSTHLVLCDDNKNPENELIKYVYYVQEPKGFFPSMCEKFLAEKKKIGSLKKTLNKTDPQFAVVDAQYRQIKSGFNSIYGILGSQFFPFYCLPMAISITSSCRQSALLLKEFNNQNGVAVMGDTDSSYFVPNDPKENIDVLVKNADKYI